MKNIKFINAGAGSGKTYRLTEILGQWIEDENNANEVLLTTFTKKAAAEIRERAQSKLLENKKFTQANKLNEAFIGTVHSIGYQFIKKYWYILGISPELTEISEMERDVFFSQAIASVPSSKELYQLNDTCYQLNFHKFEDDIFKFNKEQWKEDVLNIMNEALTNNINLINDNKSLEVSLNKFRNVFNDKTEEINANQIIDEIEVLFNQNPRYARNKVDLSNNYLSFANGELISLLSRKNDHNLRLLIDIEQSLKKLFKLYDTNGTRGIQESLPKTNIVASEIFKLYGENYIKLIFKIAKESLNSYEKFK